MRIPALFHSFLLRLTGSFGLVLLPLTSVLGQAILVLPYVQPGASGTLEGKDDKRLMWLTDAVEGDFTVEYGVKGAVPLTVKPERVALDFAAPKPKPDANPSAKPETEQHYLKYTALLSELPFDSEVSYRVKQGNTLVREGAFPTCASATKPTRFVMVGDMANGGKAQNAIAMQISLARPQFLVALGDIVYPTGRVSQYMDHFWPTYNRDGKASAETGAPLMAAVPFYAVLGNHDTASLKLANWPDGLGVYHFFHAPHNGPGEGTWSTPIGAGGEAKIFRARVGGSYPALSQYSFDCGPAHFVVLDNSGTSQQDAPKLREWIGRDLRASKARWKFVCFHCPMFHSSREHYTEQRTRLLSPLLEECGVDIVFAGHVHNYQRSKPMKFAPSFVHRISGGMVNGEFALDSTFDGIKETHPQGIIHIVAGGGGAPLYKGDLKKNTEFFAEQPEGNWAEYTAKFVTDQHSFTVIDLARDRFEMRALNEKGEEFDRVVITKP